MARISIDPGTETYEEKLAASIFRLKNSSQYSLFGESADGVERKTVVSLPVGDASLSISREWHEPPSWLSGTTSFA